MTILFLFYRCWPKRVPLFKRRQGYKYIDFRHLYPAPGVLPPGKLCTPHIEYHANRFARNFNSPRPRAIALSLPLQGERI